MIHQTQVLIVDDEASVRLLLQECLEAEGYLCNQAETVEQAIARLAGGDYTLVVSDLRMPGMDGFDLLHHVRGLDHEVGVVMVSAVDEIDTAVRMLREGALDYLVKPFRTDEIVERVRAACERVRLERDNRRYAMHLREEVERRAEELRATQDDLRRSEERRRLLLDHAGEAFLLLDATTGEVVEANRRCEELLGYERHHMEGLPLEELDVEGALGGILSGIASTVNTPGRRMEGTALLEGGGSSTQRVRVSASRIETPGGSVDFLVLRDGEEEGTITPDLTMFGSVSHELRTPLTSIAGHAELIESLSTAEIDGQTRRSLHNIRANAHHCLRLVEGLLDLSARDGTGEDRPEEWIDLEELLGELATTLRPLARRPEVELQVRTDSGVDRCRTEPTLLRQVLLNLGVNALHATNRGGVRVRVALCEEELRARVVDTGVGIAREDLQRIFEEGEVAGGRVTGAGLGLAIARRLLRDAGGELRAWSRFGMGSVFEVRLPVTVEETTSHKTPESTTSRRRAAGSA